MPMAMRRMGNERQESFWVDAAVTCGPRHVFYDRLNELLADADFDRRVEDVCRPFYKQGGRGSVPPGRYFRMLLVGYFEGLDSQRGIAWRCEDSLSLRRFLKLAADERVPDHSSLTRIGLRLPAEVSDEVFAIVLDICRKSGLLNAKTSVAVDSTTLEANAAMKSIVRRDTGEDWNQYVRRLMVEAGETDDPDEPSDEDVRRFDRKRKGKKVSNDDWVNPHDPDAEITKMKDGRTHLAYKAEHVVDLNSEVILAAEVTGATAGDASTLITSVGAATKNIERSGGEELIHEVVADKGYHANQTLADCEDCGLRTYIPERKANTKDGRRRWQDKPSEHERAYRANKTRTGRAKGKRYQKLRSERVERSFAHMCDTGGGRRTWLRGLKKVRVRYRMLAAARNLSLVLRKTFGYGTPRSLQGVSAAWWSLGSAIGRSQDDFGLLLGTACVTRGQSSASNPRCRVTETLTIAA